MVLNDAVRSRMLPWWATALLALGCSSESPEPAAIRQAVLDAEAYRNLVTLDVKPLGSACPNRDDQCLVGPSASAATGSGGRVAFWDVDFGKVVYSIDEGIKQIGRIGDGPGEYRIAAAAAWSDGDILQVYDALLQRRVRFDREGQAVATDRMPLPPGYIAGFFVGDEFRAVSVEPDRKSGSAEPSKVVLLALTTDDAPPQRLATLPVEQAGFGIADMRPIPKLFEATPQWAFAPDGMIAYSSGDRFILELFDTAGSPNLRTGFDVTPRPVTPAEVELAVAKRLKGIVNPKMRSAATSQPAEHSASHPAITGLKLLGNGQVWVREAPSEKGDLVRWVIFDRSGAPLGGVQLPVDLSVLAAQGDSILVNDSGESLHPGGLIWMTLVPAGQKRLGAQHKRP